ncbi:MAG: chemotaxis protein CheA [Candidatus Zixiibacteriota bacterium]
MSNKINKKLNQISEDLVFIEPDDLQELASLHESMEELSKLLVENDYKIVSQIVLKCAEIIEAIILEEEGQPEKAIEKIGKCIENGILIISEGFSIDEIDFPENICKDIDGLKAKNKSKEVKPDETNANIQENSGDKNQQEQKHQNQNKASGYTLPSNVDEQILTDFLAEQKSVMDDMEEYILQIENDSHPNAEQNLKRLLHTLKGESGLLGLMEIQKVCHQTEEMISKFEIHSLIDRLLDVHDWFLQKFKVISGYDSNPLSLEKMLNKLQEKQKMQSSVSDLDNITEIPDISGIDPALLSEFINESNEHLDKAEFHLLNIETDPDNSEALNAIFRAFHTIKGAAGFMSLQRIGKVAHESENLLDKARKGDIKLIDAAIDITFEAVDVLKALILELKAIVEGNEIESYNTIWKETVKKVRDILQNKAFEQDEDTSDIEAELIKDKKIGEILSSKGVISRDDVEEALEEQQNSGKRIGEILVEKKKLKARDMAKALRSQKKANHKKNIVVKETVKVDATRLDRLVDTIGELVIAESMVAQSQEITRLASSGLMRHINQLDKITRELQEMATSLRMVPVSGTFHKMARLVRDLSKKFDKTVNFVMTGEDTELDKTVVDKIGDPLIHMVRNAIDHGIEGSSQARREAGKPEAGKIELRAFHKAGNIHIQVEDDGKGLNKEAILNKAIEKNLISEDCNLSDKEIYNLIFEPGFSTAQKITNVSGRGVGMDVVRKNIESLRGKVDINSTPGKGSVFTIRLPLTLAIIDGMIVRCGQERYILPTLSIVRSLKPSKSALTDVLKKGEILTNQGKLIPIFRLANIFNIENAEYDPTKAIVVIIENDSKQTGIVVDEILNQQQIVIKTLGANMENIKGISGGTIMPDGRVGLILDVSGLVSIAYGNIPFKEAI